MVDFAELLVPGELSSFHGSRSLGLKQLRQSWLCQRSSQVMVERDERASVGGSQLMERSLGARFLMREPKRRDRFRASSRCNVLIWKPPHHDEKVTDNLQSAVTSSCCIGRKENLPYKDNTAADSIDKRLPSRRFDSGRCTCSAGTDILSKFCMYYLRKLCCPTAKLSFSAIPSRLPHQHSGSVHAES